MGIKKLFKRKEKKEDKVSIDFLSRDKPEKQVLVPRKFKSLPKPTHIHTKKGLEEKEDIHTQIEPPDNLTYQESLVHEPEIESFEGEDEMINALEKKIAERKEFLEYQKKQKELAKLEAERKSLMEAQELKKLREEQLMRTQENLKENLHIATPIQKEEFHNAETIQEGEIGQVQLLPFDKNLYKRCPVCNKKVLKGKVMRETNCMKQVIKCKDRNCEFVKVLQFNL
jgi:hypothetical protein